MIASLRQRAELYGTPYFITKSLLRREFFPGLIYEPAAGMGDIVTVLAECGYRNIYAADKNDWGYSPCHIEDFLESRSRPNSIVTNPPFSLKAEFLAQAKRLARQKIGMLLPVDFQYTKTFLLEHLHDTDFAWKALYAFVQGIGWLRRTDRSGRRKVGWFVFERGYVGPVIRETILYRPNR